MISGGFPADRVAYGAGSCGFFPPVMPITWAWEFEIIIRKNVIQAGRVIRARRLITLLDKIIVVQLQYDASAPRRVPYRGIIRGFLRMRAGWHEEREAYRA